jgi:chemotaxis protein MotB
MSRKLSLFLLPLLFASGCASTEPFEEQIRELTWRLNASEQAAEQATVDKRLAEREVAIARGDNKVLNEKLALAFDALREARARVDETLHDRVTELSESGQSGEALQISQYGGVVLESGILFGSGRHQLTKSGKQALEPLVATLLKPDYAEYEIELAGHSDSDPIRRSASKYRDNHDLAALRANSVRRFLIERGLPSDRVYLSSWGPTHPISATEKAPNRRVELVLHPIGDEQPNGGSEDVSDASLPASASRD